MSSTQESSPPPYAAEAATETNDAPREYVCSNCGRSSLDAHAGQRRLRNCVASLRVFQCLPALIVLFITMGISQELAFKGRAGLPLAWLAFSWTFINAISLIVVLVSEMGPFRHERWVYLASDSVSFILWLSAAISLMALVSEFSQPDKVASFWDPPSSNAASLGSVPAAMAAAVLSTIEVLICIIIVTFRTVIVIRDTLDARKVKGNYELVGMEVV